VSVTDVRTSFYAAAGAGARAAVRVTGRFDELVPCDARSMTDKPRYQLRANRIRTKRPTLWRLQWWIVGVDTLVGIVAIVLVLTGAWPLAAALMGLSALISIFILFIANGRRPNT
jgi:uncharacterized membrane protein